MQAQPQHTNRGSCCQAPVIWTRTKTPGQDAGVEWPPALAAQFFYRSTTSIDEPVQNDTASTSAQARLSKIGIRPFSQADSNALERAWQQLGSPDDRRNHEREKSPTPSLEARNETRLDSLVDTLYERHKVKHDLSLNVATYHKQTETPTGDLGRGELPFCCPELPLEVSANLNETICKAGRQRHPAWSRDVVAQRVLQRLLGDRVATRPSSAQSGNEFSGDARHVSHSRGRSASDTSRRQRSNAEKMPTEREHSLAASASKRLSMVGDGLTGMPFLRVERERSSVKSASPAETPREAYNSNVRGSVIKPQVIDGPISTKSSHSNLKQSRTTGPAESLQVPVGASRLHEVSLPSLLLRPIYWSPINDVATVMRATWFYRDSMLPVEPIVANQLEIGYRDLQPWTETWQDEIRSAVEAGALGEEKVSMPLWPSQPSKAKAATNMKHTLLQPLISADPFCAARCFQGEAAAEGSLVPLKFEEEEGEESPKSSEQPFANYHILYRDSTLAYLLRPNQKPSAYHGRRPLNKIYNKQTVGIPVCRGFDRHVWNKLQGVQVSPPRGTTTADITGAIANASSYETQECPGCHDEREKATVTDLVLVIHGIGQSLAERIASYHFTHAVTALRRAVNLELHSESLKPIISDKSGNIVLLPINWRQLLSFEEGGPAQDQDKENYAPEGFSLQDIEPKSIPAVRGLMSDVMFDIPFYMSHHKPKIIQAVVGEANRVYSLWCQNNPDFTARGRVHVIGHSLGSVMAVDILSRQPNKVSDDVHLQSVPSPSTTFFFDTSNLFLVGSPAGFFLLLERGNLLPRRGRTKPGSDKEDSYAAGVVGEGGTFGCLAVDNIYNVLAKEDPIAYLLNGTIDAPFAASLQPAFVPSATASWFKSMSDVLRGLTPSHTATNAVILPTAVGDPPTKPPTARLPSQLELEVHDFTREEIAEKKAFLLNDNGQVDYYLRSGSGPLEIQYLNMLSAHTSYWANRDFIRFLCVEISRKPGKANTLPAMRAVKASRRVKTGKKAYT